MEAVRIASAGYPSRTPYKNFYKRYLSLLVMSLESMGLKESVFRYQILKLHEQGEDARSSCQSLFEALGIQKIEGQFGETKIFLKAGMVSLHAYSSSHGRLLTPSLDCTFGETANGSSELGSISFPEELEAHCHAKALQGNAHRGYQDSNWYIVLLSVVTIS